jgi:hypothetical protein
MPSVLVTTSAFDAATRARVVAGAGALGADAGVESAPAGEPDVAGRSIATPRIGW